MERELLNKGPVLDKKGAARSGLFQKKHFNL